MSAASRLVTRSAGRGTTIHGTAVRGTAVRSQPQPPLNHRLRDPASRPPPGGRGTSANAAQSSLAQSVLTRRQRGGDRGGGRGGGATSRQTNRSMGMIERLELRNGHDAMGETRKNRFSTEEWYRSDERREALQNLTALQSAAEKVSVSKELDRPFAGPSEVGELLPEDHWARGFVDRVLVNVSRNGELSVVEKEKVVGSVLHALGELSRNDEADARFQDAEV